MPTDLAIVVVMLVFVGMGISAFLLRLIRVDIPLGQIFTPEHVQMLNMVDNSVQCLAYRTGLVLLAVFSFVGMAMIHRNVDAPQSITGWAVNGMSDPLNRLAGIFVIGIAVVFPLMQNWILFSIEGIIGCCQRLFIVCVMLCIVKAGRYLQTRTLAIISLVFILCYIVFWISAGSKLTLFLNEPILSSIEAHFSIIVIGQ
jgi:hypothetical protein